MPCRASHFTASHEIIRASIIDLKHLPDWSTAAHGAGDYDLNARSEAAPELTPAAVLVPIVMRKPSPTILLTKRTDHLHDHPGQVSFPGGRVEEADLTAVDTALRETTEEIGLPANRIEVIGFLDLYETGSRYLIAPIVALLPSEFDLDPDPFEVADVFEVPLSHFLESTNRAIHSIAYRGHQRRYYAYEHGGYYIWGATAGILSNLARRLLADDNMGAYDSGLKHV